MRLSELVTRCGFIIGLALAAWTAGLAQSRKEDPISFKKDIAPVIGRRCLPCHAEDNFNPSELSLDSYEAIMEGGKHGTPVVPGNPNESLIMKKTSTRPPFGDRMPLNPKWKIDGGSAKWLSDEEIRLLAAWINQGAKNN
jgi:hypothetical protein